MLSSSTTGASAATAVANVGAPLLVLLVELVDRSLVRDRLNARAHRLPRVAMAGYEQWHVVRRAHSESLERVGGSAEADEAGEVAVPVGSGELAQEVRDSGALVDLDDAVQGSEAASVFGGQGWGG